MTTRFDGLRAVFLNCSLTADRTQSHTMRLLRRAAGIMETEGVSVDVIHARDHDIAFGMRADMTEHGAEVDEWPQIQAVVDAADILVIGTPIWLGAKSSVATMAIERLYAGSAETNDKGQYKYYGKAAGCVVTGNEDGVKACARDVLYALAHIGYTIPPGPDCGWLGEIGPGPSYGDDVDGQESPAGYDSEFTNKNTTIMAWNLMHTARLLRDAGGFPTTGNSGDWEAVTNAADQSPASA
ncbi:MAG: NAD(P)H-dependent oxidoreductase [Acidimicrobiales bacterium]